jgi:hypothetical protein
MAQRAMAPPILEFLPGEPFVAAAGQAVRPATVTKSDLREHVRGLGGLCDVVVKCRKGLF